jgi:hypothetical protein
MFYIPTVRGQIKYPKTARALSPRQAAGWFENGRRPQCLLARKVSRGNQDHVGGAIAKLSKLRSCG